jgi:hypothetical protein
MNIPDLILEFIQRETVKTALIQFGVFLILTLLAIAIGRLMPVLLRWTIQRFAPQTFKPVYKNLVEPIQTTLKVAATLVLIALALSLLKSYPTVYEILKFCIDLAVTISVAWLISPLFRQFVRVYGIEPANWDVKSMKCSWWQKQLLMF